MGSISKVARIGFAMFLLGVVLLSVLAMFKGNAKGASSEYNEALSLMTEKSAKARQALIEDCKARERLRIMFLLDYNSGVTSPSAQEVSDVKQRLLNESCFLDQAAQ